MVYYDILCYIDVSQEDGKNMRVYLNVEIQNNPYPGYSIITRGYAYISRIVSEQWGSEYDDKNYDGMKKVYSLWIMPKAPKRKDGYMNVYETNERIICGTTVEEKEVYDKGVILVIYLNKEHDTNEKYIIYDNILTPLVAFLNNVLSYQEKRKIMKEYGFNVIDKEIEKMCNLGEMIEREAKQAKNIEHLQNVMHELQCSLEKAMDILKLTDDERKEIRKYFQA